MKAKLMEEFRPKLWHAYALGLGLGVSAAAILVVVLIYGSVLRHQSQQETTRNRITAQNNRRSIANVQRIQRLEHPATEEQAAQVLRLLDSLRRCARSPACRRAVPGVERVVRNISASRSSSSRRRSGGSGGSGGATSGGGSGSSGGGSGSGTTTAPRRPRSPSPAPSRPSTPQPTTRPPAASPPRAPAPSRPAPTPAPAAPAPRPPAVPPVTTPPVGPVPPVTTPPVTPPVVPPVTVPVPIQVCTPVVQVNCRRLDGRIVSAEATADPASNSGRGNTDDPLCERLKAPCDEDGQPVFPPAFIGWP